MHRFISPYEARDIEAARTLTAQQMRASPLSQSTDAKDAPHTQTRVRACISHKWPPPFVKKFLGLVNSAVILS
jgi:hypothetical protein